MPAFIIPKKQVQQPQTFVPLNPWIPKDAFVVNAAVQRCYNYAKYVETGTVPRRATPHGTAFAITQTASRVELGQVATISDIGASIVFHFWYRQAGGTSSARISEVWSTINGYTEELYVDQVSDAYSAGNIELRRLGGATQYWYTTNQPLQPNNLYTLVVTMTPSSVQMWLNGRPLSLTTSGSFTAPALGIADIHYLRGTFGGAPASAHTLFYARQYGIFPNPQAFTDPTTVWSYFFRPQEMLLSTNTPPTRTVSSRWETDVFEAHYGKLPTSNNIGPSTSAAFLNMLERHRVGGDTFSATVVSTYSLVNTRSAGYYGGVLAPNGDTHFVPFQASVGQKIDQSGVVSTYSLVYTSTSGMYGGGVLSPNGDIHFVPYGAVVGQKINASGSVTTYSLVYTTNNAYLGGVLDANGDAHFISMNAVVGQKISSAGLVSTYSLVYTAANAYVGGILDPNGDIHFVPLNAAVGQKISPAGVVSTYSLVYTGSQAYAGGVLASNGDLHFVPYTTSVGQKISPTGVVSTYSLVYTASGGAYIGGVLAPNGDVHFVPYAANVGQKVSSTGVVSTYSLVHTITNAYIGGILTPSGDINLINSSANVGQKISTGSAIPFGIGVCASPFFNKL